MEKKITFDGKILTLNKQAMDALHSDELEKSLKTLKEAEQNLNEAKYSKNSELWGITYNNFGCIYKKAGNHKAAMFYLTKALEMEVKTSYDATNLASTHLNISAILSSVGNHESSLVHSLAALKTLQLFNSPSINYTISVIISYHSIGVEYEHLRRFNEAISAYRRGWEIAEKDLGSDHKLTETLRKCFSKGFNVPTMPSLKQSKKQLKSIKKKNRNYTNLPLLTTRNSQPQSFTAPRKSVHKSSERETQRTTYYKHPRRSVSPITNKSSLRFVNELESINKLIKELDGTKPKQKKAFNRDLEKKVIKIQRWWRLLLNKKKKKSRLKRIEARKTEISRKIDRNKILRPIPEKKYERKIDAVIKIQSWVKMLRARNWFQKVRNSAIVIQKNFRKWVTRRLFKLIVSAVLFIQSVFRGHRVRRSIKQ